MSAAWGSREPAGSRSGGDRMNDRTSRSRAVYLSGERLPCKRILLAVLVCLGPTLVSIGCAPQMPSAEPSQTVPPLPTSLPSQAEASQAPPPSFPYPAAVLIFDPSNGGLDLVSQDGIELGDMGTIDWSNPDRLRGTTLGAIGGQFGRVRFAYFTASDSGLSLNVRSSIGNTTLGEFPMDAVLAGSVPAGLLVVSDPSAAGPDEESESAFYVVDPARRTGLDQPALEGLTPGAVPLVLQIEAGQPGSIVYCLGPADRSMSEDDLCLGLYRVELASREVDQIVADDLAIVALSPDLRIVALASKDRTPPEVRSRHLDTGAEVVFRSEAGERDVRQGAFSPAGTRLAWTSLGRDEGGEDVLALNLVSSAGGPATRLASATLSEAIGDQISDARVVGWLDDGRLLLELSTLRRSALYVLLLGEGRIDRIASGRLAGLIYR